MKKRFYMLILTLALLLTLYACGSSGQEEDVLPDPSYRGETAEEVEEKEYQKKMDAIEPTAYQEVDGLHLEPGSYISVIGKSRSGEFWEELERGAKQAVADINELLGYEGEDKVRMTYSGPEDQDSVDEQVNILDEELARYPAALCISIADAQACEVQFDLAAESGIPIVAFDSGSDYHGLVATVSTDNEAAAGMAADRMAELLDGGGEVAVFIQDSKSASAAEREKGFTERLKTMHPDITVVHTCYMDQLEKTKEEIVEETEGLDVEDITDEEALAHIFEKYPDLKGCFAANEDAAKLVLTSVESLENERIKVVSFDTSEEQLKALEEGDIDGLVLQNPFGMGYASIIAAARAALSMGNEAYIDTGYAWVTAAGLENEEVQKMLY